MSFLQFPWDTEAAPAVPPAEPDASPSQPKPRGRRPAAGRATEHAREGAGAAAASEPAWRYHHLTVSGAAAQVADFAAAARGSGVTPWQLDYAPLEEDIFILAISQPASRRNLTVEGCRILARQFRDRVAAHQARAAALVGVSLACPFDLHALLPVPDATLRLGPTDPAALAWLAAHWGVTDRLRQVAVRERATTGRRRPRGHTVIGYGFLTDGDTPHAAIATLAARWPALRFALQPRPAD